MEAWKKGDVQAIQGLLTRKAQETIAKPEKVDGESHHFNPKAASPDATYSIQSVVAEGTTILAAVRITDPMDPMAAKGTVLRWRLKPEGQTWRIAKMVYVGPDDIAVSIFDLENPSADAGLLDLAMAAMARGLGGPPPTPGKATTIPDSPGEDAAKPLPGGMSLADFEQSWKHGEDINATPAATAIQSLCKSMNVKASLDPAVKRQQSVSVKAGDFSRLQAIEEICGNGAHAVFENGTAKILPGPATSPTAAAGPFVIWVNRLQEFPPFGTARLQVHVQSVGLPSAVAHAMTNMATAPRAFSILSAESEPGVSLIDPNGFPLATFNSQASEYSFAEPVQLRNLLRMVKKFTLKTQVTARVPIKIMQLKLPSLTVAAGCRKDAFEMTVRKMEKSPMAMPGQEPYVITFQISGAQRDAIEVQFLDASSKMLRSQPGGFMGFVKEDEASFTVRGKPASTIAVVTTEQRPVKFDAAITDVPLGAGGSDARATQGAHVFGPRMRPFRSILLPW